MYIYYIYTIFYESHHFQQIFCKVMLSFFWVFHLKTNGPFLRWGSGWLRFTIYISLYIYITWVVPLPSNSHHQDWYVFRIGDPYKPSFATGTVRGDTPIYNYIYNHKDVIDGHMKKYIFFPQIKGCSNGTLVNPSGLLSMTPLWFTISLGI